MKNKYIFFVLTSLLLCFVACQKDEVYNGIDFKATMQLTNSDGKTTMDADRNIRWTADDRVMIYGCANQSVSGVYYPNTVGETSTNLRLVEGTEDIFASNGNNRFYALYPAENVLAYNKINLPAVQQSVAGELTKFPMVAAALPGNQNTTPRTLNFKNPCAVIKLHLQTNQPVKIQNIKLRSTNVNISGQFTINYKDYQLADANVMELTEQPLAEGSQVSGEVTLNMSTPQWINGNGHDFYVYLRTDRYNAFGANWSYFDIVLDAVNADDITFTLHNENATGFQALANTMYTISKTNLTFSNVTDVPDTPDTPETPTVPEGAIPGKFKISDNTEIYFSRGNLIWSANGTHAVATGGTKAGTWSFHEQQYGILPESAPLTVTATSGQTDLMGWGTSGYDGVANRNVWPYNMPTSANSGATFGPDGAHDLTGNYRYYDWGVYNAISNGGNQPGLWRTLSKSEYKYLLDHTRHGLGTVNGVHGLILIPDNYVFPTAALQTRLRFDNGSTTTNANLWASNTITASEWASMEQNGAVFLPAAGFRSWDNDHNPHVVRGNYGVSGDYWSSTAVSGGGDNSQRAWYFVFENDQLHPGNSATDVHLRYVTHDWEWQRSFGRAVRLVQVVTNN